MRQSARILIRQKKQPRKTRKREIERRFFIRQKGRGSLIPTLESFLALHQQRSPVYILLVNKYTTNTMYENDVEDYRKCDGFCERDAFMYRFDKTC